MLVITHGGVIRLLRCLAAGRRYSDMLAIDVGHASLHPLPWPPPATAATADTGRPAHRHERVERVEADPVGG